MLAIHGVFGGFHDGVKSAWADSPRMHGEQPALGSNATPACVLPFTVVRATTGRAFNPCFDADDNVDSKMS